MFTRVKPELVVIATTAPSHPDLVCLAAQSGVSRDLAASAAALTIYDMAKAIDRAMTIDGIRLVRKSGGRSGDFVREGEPAWR